MESGKFKVGDTVRRTTHYNFAYSVGSDPFIVRGYVFNPEWREYFVVDEYSGEHSEDNLELVEPATDAVPPDHYRFGDAQVIDITRHLGFLEGSAIKYLARAGRKGDRLTDLLKAQQFVNWLVEDAEKEG